MNIIPIKTPLVVKKLFPDYIWDKATIDKVLYLTFDDGPTPEITNWTLQELKKHNAKATFFCIGNNIEKHPKIFQQILEEGHAIGNHTHNHIKGWETKTKDYIENVLEAQKAISNQIQNSKFNDSEINNPQSSIVKLFRPPYGRITPKQGKKLMEQGYSIIMWDVLSFDWDKTISNDDCFNNVISKTKKGSIIVFHDSVKANERLQYALPKVLDYFTKKGYEFKSLQD